MIIIHQSYCDYIGVTSCEGNCIIHVQYRTKATLDWFQENMPFQYIVLFYTDSATNTIHEKLYLLCVDKVCV